VLFDQWDSPLVYCLLVSDVDLTRIPTYREGFSWKVNFKTRVNVNLDRKYIELVSLQKIVNGFSA
jgi:hypothetical protein